MIRRAIISAAVFYVLLLLAAPGWAKVVTLSNSGLSGDTCEILFIGSSYFNYNYLPELCENLALSSNKKVYIEANCPNGIYLSDHVNNAVTEAMIHARDWDYVVLQGVGRLMAYPEDNPDNSAYDALVKLKEKISGNCPETQIVFCLPWAFEDGMTWAGLPDNYIAMQIKAKNNTLVYANEIGFCVAPVGWAWYHVLEELNYPLHYLHMKDWNHPTLKGSYLMACVIHSTLFQESSVGNAFHAGLAGEDALYFQTMASKTVLDTPELWNIPGAQGGSGIHVDRTGTNIIRSYPNPASDYMDVFIESGKAGFMEFSVLDQMGKCVSGPWKEMIQPGRHSLRLECHSLPGGLCFFKAERSGNVHYQKMLILH